MMRENWVIAYINTWSPDRDDAHRQLIRKRVTLSA